ncbi:lipid storage droplets surface-binding protein 1 isoform X2 [Ceratina calcarata]|uniref:Lipid storage droplets surface-binding protein 1 isoform X2 n=1 Tax=Ceratina calcarata TaxID=156304 RepID=A0AAJ7S2P3_9HYME|nr:lipid storage droplets surface-binding protein 1 isoform X2 [Ceratina calcarata]
MARTNVKRRQTGDLVRLESLESVARITSLPIVEHSMHIAGNVYDKLKKSNSLMNWSLCTAEQSFAIATAKLSTRPVVYVLNGPIMTIDQLLCKGIDIVEQRVPSVHLPPYLMYYNAREYVDKKIVRPVLMRAGSVKDIGSQAASVAADTLDGALTVADKYVDRYLPADPTDKMTDAESGKISKATRTIKHGARLSRKLQKRLTRRTLAEARALKQQGTECIHVLLYVVELLATDPKLAYQKAKELWASLSLPEPENQARPQTLEQLMVLLTRESARRVVHLVNRTTVLAAKTPKNLGIVLTKVSHQLMEIAHSTFKMIPLIGKEDVYTGISMLRMSLERFNSTTNHLLEQLAGFLAGRPSSASKAPRVQARRQNNHLMGSNSNNPSINGGDID